MEQNDEEGQKRVEAESPGTKKHLKKDFKRFRGQIDTE